MGWWAWAAWQPEAVEDVSPEVARILQPWRVRA
jgi:hypothetical protein